LKQLNKLYATIFNRRGTLKDNSKYEVESIEKYNPDIS